MVTHSMEKILNMQYYGTTTYSPQDETQSPFSKKRRCLGKEVIVYYLEKKGYIYNNNYVFAGT